MAKPYADLTADPWGGMPVKTFKRICRYTRDTANALGLYDWKIEISHVPTDDEDAGAEVGVIYGRRSATIKLSHDFATLLPEEQRHYVVHELLHIHLDPCESLLAESLPDAIGTTAWGSLEHAQKERVEHAVDAIATAIAPLLPLPPTGKKSKAKDG